ncbi:hypothetical protein GLE_4867 [Lysobacter enzymogenes]|uniref:Uncharacterized protein n=1 Tax=Lysobacter enzymogenes TaxID=69 RepID=A0A0S2DP47_LYSEN|nr:hypothetical protein GLE_4867 [Lysobacter enzymogenes]
MQLLQSEAQATGAPVGAAQAATAPSLLRRKFRRSRRFAVATRVAPTV